jgi:hypothetical protein
LSMKAWIVFLILPLFAMAAGGPQKYMNVDRSFEFTLPAQYNIHAESGKANATQSYIPVCQDDDIVCVVYPPDRY